MFRLIGFILYKQIKKHLINEEFKRFQKISKI